MNSSGGAFFALFLYLQIVASLALLVGVIYALYCLNRMSQNIERLADAAQFLMDAKIADAQNAQIQAWQEQQVPIHSAPRDDAPAPTALVQDDSADRQSAPFVAAPSEHLSFPKRSDESKF